MHKKDLESFLEKCLKIKSALENHSKTYALKRMVLESYKFLYDKWKQNIR